MTEGSPARGAVERAAPQEMRVSHADRDQVVDVLRDAAAEGRLTAEELDDRVEKALRASVLADLAVLTRDLPEHPASPAVPATDIVKIEKRFGTVNWTGTWLVPRQMDIRLTVGNARLDFTNAVITHDELLLNVDLGIGGDLTLLARPDIAVVTDGVEVRSMAEIKARPRPDVPVALRVTVTGRLRGGNLEVRYPKNTR